MKRLDDLFKERAIQKRRLFLRGVFFGGVLMFGVVGRAYAGDVKTTTSLEARGQWDSNPLMLTHDAKAVYQSIITPKLDVIDKTPLSALDLTVWVNQNTYNDSAYNSTDFHGIGAFSRTNERWQAGVDSSVDYDTTRQSEWNASGYTSKNDRELLYQFTPSITYSPVQTISLKTNMGYTRASFEGKASRDYDIVSASQTVTKSFTPLNTGFLSLQAQHYRTLDDLPQSRSDTVGPMAGWTTKLSSKLTASVSGGGQYSRQEGENVSSSQWKLYAVYAGSLVFKGLQDNISLSSQRTKQAFNYGAQYYMTTVSLSEARQMTPTFAVNMGATYQFADYSAYRGDAFDYRYNGNVGVRYDATRTLSLSAQYRYRLDSWTSGNQAHENLGLLGLNYHYQM